MIDSLDYASYVSSIRIPIFSKLNYIKVLDISGSSISSVIIAGYSNIVRLKITFCPKLNTISITQSPKLQVVDFTGNKTLQSIEIDPDSKLVSCDLSFSEKLATFSCNLSDLEYLSIRHTKIAQLPILPSILYIDISATPLESITFLESSPKLNTLIAENMKITSLDISNISALVVQSTVQNIIVNRTLQELWCQSSTNIIGASVSENGCLPDGKMLGKNFSFFRTSDLPWLSSYRKLFGPWPTVNETLRQVKPVNSLFSSPSESKMPILGALFGASIGDCLGLSNERQSLQYLNFLLSKDLDITWSHPRPTRRMKRGWVSDSMLASLVFMRTVCSKMGVFDVKEAAKRLKGIDSTSTTVIGVMNQAEFLQNPLSASQSYWKRNGSTPSGTGAITRSVATGVFRFWEEEIVILNATTFCKMTHYDDRCTFAAVCFALFISRLIRGCLDIDQTINDAIKTTIHNSSYIDEIQKYITATSLEDLRIGDYLPEMLQALGCGIVALRQNWAFTEALINVIHCGGNASTNAAVVGALIGARDGYKCIPKDLVHYLWFAGTLMKDVTPFMKLQGIVVEPTDLE